jgi:hypothetical protein
LLDSIGVGILDTIPIGLTDGEGLVDGVEVGIIDSIAEGASDLDRVGRLDGLAVRLSNIVGFPVGCVIRAMR